jgi:hypothetical protein
VGDAAAAVRALPLARRCGATVTIAGGVYGGAANALRLTEEDSGCPGALPAPAGKVISTCSAYFLSVIAKEISIGWRIHDKAAGG